MWQDICLLWATKHSHLQPVQPHVIWIFFLNTRRTQWITTQEKTRAQFLTDKTWKSLSSPHIRCFFSMVEVKWISEGLLQAMPSPPRENNCCAGCSSTFQSLSPRGFPFLHILPYNYAQGSTQNPRPLPLLHTSTINHLQRPFRQLCIITPPWQLLPPWIPLHIFIAKTSSICTTWHVRWHFCTALMQ